MGLTCGGSSFSVQDGIVEGAAKRPCLVHLRQFTSAEAIGPGPSDDGEQSLSDCAVTRGGPVLAFCGIYIRP